MNHEEKKLADRGRVLEGMRCVRPLEKNYKWSKEENKRRPH